MQFDQPCDSGSVPSEHFLRFLNFHRTTCQGFPKCLSTPSFLHVHILRNPIIWERIFQRWEQVQDMGGSNTEIQNVTGSHVVWTTQESSLQHGLLGIL